MEVLCFKKINKNARAGLIICLGDYFGLREDDIPDCILR